MPGNDAIKAIKERLGIVELVRRYVDLKQNGSRFVAPCPFHQETKPSFYVMPDKGIFHCFGCQASGDIFEFYSRINGLDFKETLEQLADETGITLPAFQTSSSAGQTGKTGARQQLLAMHTLACRHFIGNLDRDIGEPCREYIRKRGISPEIVSRFELGWAAADWRDLTNVLQKSGYDLKLASDGGLVAKSDSGRFYDRFRGRLVFPIKSLSSHVIAFGGRIIADKDEPKYINSTDTPIYKKKENLFGLPQARRAISAKGFAFLTEGYMDVLTLHQFGYDNGVGVLGTALTDEQIARLGGFTSRVHLLFDGDRAGRKAALRSCGMFLGRGFSCKVVILPEPEDIDSLLRTKGCGAFEKLIETAPDGLTFCANILRNISPVEAVEWARDFLANIRVPELKSPFASRLAQALKISEPELRQGVWEKENKKTVGAQTKSRQPFNMREAQIIAYAIRYPHRLEDLCDLGAEAVLASTAARGFWSVLRQYSPEEVFHYLDESQKIFWQNQRGPGAPPLTNGDFELSLLKKELSSFYMDAQKASLSAAISGNSHESDFRADLEYLRALQETLGEKS